MSLHSPTFDVTVQGKQTKKKITVSFTPFWLSDYLLILLTKSYCFYF